MTNKLITEIETSSKRMESMSHLSSKGLLITQFLHTKEPNVTPPYKIQGYLSLHVFAIGEWLCTWCYMVNAITDSLSKELHIRMANRHHKENSATHRAHVLAPFSTLILRQERKRILALNTWKNFNSFIISHFCWIAFN